MTPKTKSELKQRSNRPKKTGKTILCFHIELRIYNLMKIMNFYLRIHNTDAVSKWSIRFIHSGTFSNVLLFLCGITYGNFKCITTKIKV